MSSRARRPKRQKCSNRSNSSSATTNTSQIDLTNDDDGLSNNETGSTDETSKGVLNDTEETLLQKSIHNIGQEFICGCCMDIMIQPTTIVPCGHTFCNQCIFQTINLDKELCPNCRTDIVATVPNRSVDNAIRSIIALQETQLQKQQQQQQQSPSASRQRSRRSGSQRGSPSSFTTGITVPSVAATTATSTNHTTITKQPVVSFFLTDDVKSFRSREVSAPPPQGVELRSGYPSHGNRDHDYEELSLSMFSTIDSEDLVETDGNDEDDEEEEDNINNNNGPGAVSSIIDNMLRNHQNQPQRRRQNARDGAVPARLGYYRRNPNLPQTRSRRQVVPSSSSSSSSSSSEDSIDNLLLVSTRNRSSRRATATTPTNTTTTTTLTSTNHPPRVQIRSDRILRSGVAYVRRGRQRQR
jgi:hypothetical protein